MVNIVFLRDTMIQGYDFKKGDWLRDEQVSEKDFWLPLICSIKTFHARLLRYSLPP
jgi:hypothetical protein